MSQFSSRTVDIQYNHLLTQDELQKLVKDAEQFIQETSLPELQKSNILIKLTWAFHCALKQNYLQEMTKVVACVHEILERDSETLINMMAEVGIENFNQQNMAYAWSNQLYESAFSQAKLPAIIAISLLLRSIVQQDPDSKYAQLFTQEISTGDSMGRSPLLMTTLTLLQLIEKFGPHYAKEVSELLNQMTEGHTLILDRLPLTIEKGGFREKDILYFLIKAMSKAAEDLPEVVMDLCTIMERLIAHNPAQLKEALFTPMKTGELEGLTTIQLIFTSLVSAAYGKDNQAALNQIVEVLTKLLATFPEEMLQAFVREIPKGENATKNGIFMSTQAFTAAKSHALDTSSIMDLWEKVLPAAPQRELTQAFAHQPTMRYSKNRFDSSLAKMQSQLQKEEEPRLNSLVGQIQAMIASTPAASLNIPKGLSCKDCFFDSAESNDNPKSMDYGSTPPPNLS